MSAATATTAKGIERRSSELRRRFHQAIFADASILDEIPNGVTLVLVPTDDQELAEAEVAKGLAVLRTGKDVYLRHVVLAELPPLPPETEEPGFVRRTRYNPDGSVAAEEIAGPNGTWVPADPPGEEGR